MMVNKEAVSIPIDELTGFTELLKPEQLELFKSTCETHHYRKNQIIFKEGEEADSLQILMSGKVKIYKDGVGGRGQIVRMISELGFFGYRALFAEEVYITTAISLEESTILSIPKDVLFSVMNRNNELTQMFLKLMAVELGFSNQQTVSLTQKHIRGRLAEALLFLHETYGLEEDESTLNVYMSREDLANLSNMTTSNAIRTLSIFSGENLIAVDGRKIKLINFKELKRISNLG